MSPSNQALKTLSKETTNQDNRINKKWDEGGWKKWDSDFKKKEWKRELCPPAILSS